ncbi:hypothetical protein HN51_033559 [Arachis hypogaea]|uniref:Uncharacterized protein LOC107471736 n=1 Tax=Arachis duranensis TaxID=130453 RepID=A0A6P4C7M6_ARADU|nr:uncharacterized protein LOC107471736 [Arachis duranensis]XP_025625062.1 uncharacterized protein LOC112717175 [Arachis hypogaea]QHO18078.1 uncharacterized protein DS421_10g317520 [Arachis hypogaea]
MLPTIQPGRDLTLTAADAHAAATFFKCISWQVEETLDLLNCPYHYVCETTYPANYPPYVDILVLLFATASYLVTLVIVATTARSRYSSSSSSTQRTTRYLLPCGPISLPLVILTFAKGPQINTLFPISSTGPAILHLVLISALVFDSQEEEEEEEEEEDENKKKKDLRYALFAASTVSGILHASLYLDYVVMPYYTGLDAMKNSRLSGECDSCVCRKEELVVGGKVVRYRAWSLTTFMVVGVLCFRIICRIAAAGNNRIMLQRIKGLMERLSWLFIFLDCVYLAAKSPHHHHATLAASFGAILLLILLHLLKQASFLFSSMLPFPTHLIVNRNSLVKPL